MLLCFTSELFFGEIFQKADQPPNWHCFANSKRLSSNFVFTTMSLGEIQTSVENFAAWKAILWCFYPMATLVSLELLIRQIDDDDDQDGGNMIPAIQGV